MSGKVAGGIRENGEPDNVDPSASKCISLDINFHSLKFYRDNLD